MNLSNLENNITSLFGKLGLELKNENLARLKEAKKKQAKFYHDFINDNIFIKVSIIRSQKAKNELEKEALIYKTLARQFKKDLFSPVGDIRFGKHKNLYWLTRSLEKGQLAGEMKDDLGFKSAFLSGVSPKRMAGIINAYQGTKVKAHFYKHGHWWYWNDLKNYEKVFFKKFIRLSSILSANEVKEAFKVFKKYASLLDKKADTLCHGDLYPNNILFKGKRICILDWDIANLNNSAFDFAFVYLLAFRSATFQKEFLKESFRLKNKEKHFEILFKLCLVSLTARFASARFLNNKKDAVFEDYIKKFKKTLKEL